MTTSFEAISRRCRVQHGAAALTLALCSAAALGCGNSNNSQGSSGPTKFTPGNLDCSADAGDWPMFGQNVCNTGSQANAGSISTTTASTLGPKWVVDMTSVYSGGGDISATPTVTGGYVYVTDWGGNITKLAAGTGAVAWTKSIGDILSAAGISKLPGFASRNAPVVTGGLVIFGALRGTSLAMSPGPSAYLIALDQNDATLKWATLLDQHEAAIIAGSPVLDGNTLYVGVSSQEEYYTFLSIFNPGKTYSCCSFRGSVVAVNATTGAVQWKTYTIADSIFWPKGVAPLDGGNFGTPDTPPPAHAWAGGAVWSSTPVVDRKRKLLYITTGNNYKNVAADADAGADQGNYIDSVMALSTDNGAVKWARSFPEGGKDVWTTADMSGPDSDFGAGANLFTANVDGEPMDLVGAGQKSGVYWALDANTGAGVWSQKVGTTGHLGGIHWGTATDGTAIYMETNFEGSNPFLLGGKGKFAGMSVSTGIWSAIDTGSGNILWQIPNPALPTGTLNGASANGPVAVTNGVLFAGSMDANGTMFALNAATGDVLWSFQSGGTVYGGPAIANGVVYWGCGYPNGVGAGSRPLGFGSTCHKLYAFAPGIGNPQTDAGAPASDAGPVQDAGTPALEAGPEAGPVQDAGTDAPADAAGE
jgi:polyvinyl alcohol dehydrogenase (cytochrome)